MRFEQFIQVLEIAKTGSLNKAAQNLFLSQPSLSQSLKNLENELGTRIFYRETSGMVLTPEGQQLIAIIEPLYNQLAMMPQFFNKEKREYTTFNISNSFLKYVINVYMEMVDVYSPQGLRSGYREVNGGEVLEDVASQRSDIGVLYITSKTKNFMLKLFEYKEIEYHKLSDDGYWIIVGQRNPLYYENRAFVTPEDILEYPLVLYEEKHTAVPQISIDEKMLRNKSVLRVNSRASMLDLVSVTNAVNIGAMSQIPYKYTEFYSYLKTIEIKMDSQEQEVGWICRKNYQPNEPARYFLTRLIEITTGRSPLRLPMDDK